MRNEPADPNAQVDDALRDAFVVEGEVARRVVAHALTPGPHRGHMRLVASLAVAAVTVCTVGVVWLSRAPAPRSADVITPVDVVMTGSFADGVLTVSIPGDGVVIAGPGQRDDRPPDGSGVVIVEGDAR